jgi:hypothetical protein
MHEIFITYFAAALLTGCATSHQVATMEGHGRKEVYNASYDQTWRAAVDAAQVGDLRVTDANRENGYIATGRGVHPHTFGENVGIWVRPVGPNQTQVEVTSKQAGPPALWIKNWEADIFSAIRANLTRTASQSYIIEPSGAQPHHYYSPRRGYIPEQALPPVAPPRSY